MNKTILIVDDFEIIVELLADELKEDYKCICGYTANDIMKYGNEVDLIISDYGIFYINENGQKDFVWSTEYLKHTSTPKILMTGATPNDGFNNLKEDIKYVDKVFFKPLDINELKIAIKDMLELTNA